MNLGRLFKRAKKAVDDRGGVDALKEDAQEVATVAKGKGSLGDKAKGAADALKDPGAPGPEKQPGPAEQPAEPGAGQEPGAEPGGGQERPPEPRP